MRGLQERAHLVRTRGGATRGRGAAGEAAGWVYATVTIGPDTDGLTPTGKSSVSGWSKAKAKLDEQICPSSPWRLHDIRRTVFVLHVVPRGTGVPR